LTGKYNALEVSQGAFIPKTTLRDYFLPQYAEVRCLVDTYAFGESLLISVVHAGPILATSLNEGRRRLGCQWVNWRHKMVCTANSLSVPLVSSNRASAPERAAASHVPPKGIGRGANNVALVSSDLAALRIPQNQKQVNTYLKALPCQVSYLTD